MRARNFFESLTYAVSGVLYALRTQRNMRIHAIMAALVLLLGSALGLSRVEMAILALTAATVVAVEMVNTAVESAVDLVTQEYEPLAKIAKNVAAGAVLVSSCGAVAVGYFLFFHRLTRLDPDVLAAVERGVQPAILGVVAAVLLVVGALKGAATPLRLQGGFPSAHSALAFSLATLVFLAGAGATATLLATALAVLVGEARIEAGFHSLFEVAAGAVVGVALTLLFSQIFLAGS